MNDYKYIINLYARKHDEKITMKGSIIASIKSIKSATKLFHFQSH